MREITIIQYDAFTTVPHKGNPAGIVFDAEGLTDQEMQAIAHKAGFNETTFVLPSDVADVRLRFFTPGYEMDLCGHATMATVSALVSRGLLPDKDKNEGKVNGGNVLELTQETRAGVLGLRVDRFPDGDILVTMKQKPAEFIPFEGSVADVADAMGLSVEDIDDSMPIVYGSTGVWTLIVPIRGLEPFTRMQPNNGRFPQILTQQPRASLHPICMETYDPKADMHGRHFSSPYSGIAEDPVTGTASGVMGAYYAKYLCGQEEQARIHLLHIEQGNEIGREGSLLVKVIDHNDTYDVAISGRAVYTTECTVQLDDTD
ncbi:PhzF family phenazine biosynthesis protein [Brevibacillus dissolubilis]|uniref:PhzF family phenazine biosynthesis protein n=1 Tax=Brevibacillus dissolubilis TaxID=1844116 RepID=UPI001117A1F1|nr:PhzF family phenazine biosynthesis protein [Brevibacillus dissolubilis]